MKAQFLAFSVAAALLSACNQPSDTSSNATAAPASSFDAAAAEAEAASSSSAAAASAEAIARQNEAYRVAITEALRQDDVAGHTYRGATAVAAAMRQIDLSETPAEYRIAYFDHIAAWENYGKLQDEYANLSSDDSESNVVASSFLCSLLSCGATPIKDRIDLLNRLRAAMVQANNEIGTTFHAVERIAVSYDAALPSANAASS